MSFGKKNLENSSNINNSIISTTSSKFSEFSFNPEKLVNKIINIKNNNQPKIIENNIHIESNINQNIQNPTDNINDILNSEIIKNMKELNLILKSLPKYNKFDALPDFQTIFQTSTDGDSAKAFHKFCDCEPNIIVVVESKDGRRFGGYTKIGFSSDGEKKKDESAFLFSLDKMKIYKIKAKYKNIFCDPDNGPCFGEKDNLIFKISDNYLSEKSFFRNDNIFYNNMKKDDIFSNEDQEFIVNKLEMIKLLK